ncbi:MAG TPA: winged helix-turn-helix domain-containing protein, partial [Steroidobacter sp.]|nr:winged helix-turn-helix domain-containing protein [Steroidobacter sp.]
MQQSFAGKSAVYCAGDLTIDTGRLSVSRGAHEIPLSKLSFDLLLVLVRAAPNVVSLEKLMTEVWPSLVVTPETVSQRIKLLRDALADDPRAPRYIAGLRGRGYRLIAPVTRVETASLVDEPRDRPAEETQSAAPRRSPPRRALSMAVVLLASAVLISGVALLSLQTDGWYSKDSARASVRASALPEHTVAVLPFDALSSEASDEMLALGVAEGLLHRLASIRDLTVIARSSSFAFRGEQIDAREIGRQLNSRYLVAGAVQRSGDRVRVTAQLIDATNGANVWSLRFDRAETDILDAEDEIVHGVARALEVSLHEGAHPFARFGADAYLSFLQGKALMTSRKAADAERAIERFSRAIELAPDFAAAYVALADARLLLAHLTGVADVSPVVVAAYHEAQPLLDRALQLDDSLGEAYVLRADLKDYAGDKAGAEADFRKGLALSPNYGAGYERFAGFLELQNRTDEALAAIDRARIVDPLTPRNHYIKALMLYGQGAIDDAEG